MSPLYSLHHLRADVRQRLSVTTDPVIHFALENQLKSLTKRDNQTRVLISLSRHKTSIRSGNVESCGLIKPVKKDHWSFSNKTESATKRMEKARLGYTTMFQQEPDLGVLELISTLGGWKKTLSKLSLDYFLDIPTEAFAEDSAALHTIFLRKLNQTTKP